MIRYAHAIMIILLPLLPLLGLAPQANAQQPLVADLDTHQIAIRSTFTGTELLLFGAVEADDQKALSDKNRGDIVLVVRGPDAKVTVRKKDRVGPIWANTDFVRFDNVPGFYAILSTRPIVDIAPHQILHRHQLGIDTILDELSSNAASDAASDASGTSGTSGNESDVDEFRQALIRMQTKDGLYQQDSAGFRFVSGRLFRARISLPAKVPVGTYQVQAFLIRDGKVAGAQFSPLFVDKVGIERQIFRFAHHYEWLYGLMSVLLAGVMGYLASVIFRDR